MDAETDRSPRWGATVLAALAWLMVVVAAVSIASFAIGRAGQHVLDPLSAVAVSVPTPGTVASSSGAPSTPPSSEPSPAPSTGTPPAAVPSTTTTPAAPGPTTPPPVVAPTPTVDPPEAEPPPPPAVPQDRVVTLTGGQVGVRCLAGVPSLRFAEPQPGWTVELGSDDGGTRVRVEFEQDEGGRSRVQATCGADGTPQVSVEG